MIKRHKLAIENKALSLYNGCGQWFAIFLRKDITTGVVKIKQSEAHHAIKKSVFK
jgi:hypothetical protein